MEFDLQNKRQNSHFLDNNDSTQNFNLCWYPIQALVFCRFIITTIECIFQMFPSLWVSIKLMKGLTYSKKHHILPICKNYSFFSLQESKVIFSAHEGRGLVA